MFFKKYGDLVVSIFYAILGIALIVCAKMLPKSKVMEIGPDFMPTVVGVIILILAVILFAESVHGFKKNVEAAKDFKDESDYKRVILSLILSLLYVYLLQPIGFLICTLVYLFAQIFVLAPDARRTKKDLALYLIIDVVFTIVVYFLFRYGFTIVLPAGILSF